MICVIEPPLPNALPLQRDSKTRTTFTDDFPILSAMSAIILLLIASLCVAGGFLLAYLWSVRTGQYEDDYSPAYRILFDNELIHTDKDTLSTANSNNRGAAEARGDKNPHGAAAEQN